jgi:hypothetical protein
MDKLSADQLINKSTKIIMQDWHTQEDAKELSRIKYFLAIQYKKLNTASSAQEWLYNWLRSEKSLKYCEWNAVTKAEVMWKNDAEIAYWWFREMNAEAQWIDKMIKAIEGFIISLNIENKVLYQTQT